MEGKGIYNSKRTVTDYLEKGDFLKNEIEVHDSFVIAVFDDINQKLDMILESQRNKEHMISSASSSECNERA